MRALAPTTALALLALAACAPPPPASPAERHARLAAAAEIVARDCAGFAGGYGSVRQLRDDANRNIVTARSLGATDAVIEQARIDARTAFNAMVVWTSLQHSCNALVSELAWQAG